MSKKVKFKDLYDVNEHGVVTNPDRISIPIPKSINKGLVKATIRLAECNRGWVSSYELWLHDCGYAGPVSYHRDVAHPTATDAAMYQAGRLVCMCRRREDHIDTKAERTRVNSVRKCIENFMDEVRLGIAELPGVRDLKQAELF